MSGCLIRFGALAGGHGALLLCVLCGAATPSAALAAGIPYSAVPLATEPHAVCPAATADRARCTAVLDATAGIPAPAIRSSATQSLASEVAIPALCFTGENEYCGGGADHGFSPQDLQSAYRLPSASAGSGEKVAIVDAYDDPNAQADLNVYRATYDLPPCESGCFTKVNQEGASKYPAANVGWSLEISLDLDMVSAACPECHILLVEANSETLENLGIAENEAAALGATEISNSYMAREIEMGKTRVDEDTKYYSHAGIPITAASGDEAYDNEQNESAGCGNCSPSFPAGLSSVIAVGGTSLWSDETARGRHESVWAESGSGCTLYIAKPAWQTDKGCTHRTDNDVAADAATNTPVSVYDTYSGSSLWSGWQLASGTSVGAPLIAAAIALESATTRAEGAEGIYKHPSSSYDVTEGTNWARLQPECAEKYLCNAEVGYDGPTGMGAPNGGASVTPPSAFTEAATGVRQWMATLNGVVNPEASETTYYFQYGATTSYGREVPVPGAKLAGHTTPVAVSQSIYGLPAASLYHFRLVAKSAGGTTYGADRTFSTAPKTYLMKFGSKGTAEGELEGPQSAATDHYGNVWITDYANNRIEEFSQAGEFIRACGSTGSGQKQFKGPAGIAVNPTTGQIYVSDSGNDRIEVLTSECGYVEAFGSAGSGNGQLSDPMGLAFGIANDTYSRAPGVLMVADAGNNRIEEFNWLRNLQRKAGEFVATYGSSGSGEGQFSDPTDVVLAGSEATATENFYVVDAGNGRVQELEEEELTYTHPSVVVKYLGQLGSKGSGEGQLLNPTAAVLDPTTGDLAVADSGNNRIEEFLPSGAYVATFGAAGSAGEDFESPRGIAVNAAGDLDIADYANDRVDVWQPAQKAPEAGPEWQVTTTPNPSGTLNSYLLGVSCASSVACTAVGDYELEKTSGENALAEGWNGTEWSIQSTPAPTGAKDAQLGGVACTAAAACLAVGSYQNSSGVSDLLSESWNGSQWKLKTLPEPSGTRGGLLESVSCSSASACTAVGYYENSSAILVPLVERWNGTEWSIQSTPAPSEAKESQPSGVSCPASNACTMVGYYKNSAGVDLPLAESWNGTEWSLKSMPSPTGAKKTTVNGVSCTAAGACTAVGRDENSSGTGLPLVERWNGSEWSLQTAPSPTGATNSPLDGVSCTAAASCTAVGVYTMHGLSGYMTLGERWNGSEWQIQATPNDEKGVGWLTGGVSCSSSSSCAAVGNAGKTFAEVYR
jgi:DNA-binding beta-propeller fold protein YncE